MSKRLRSHVVKSPSKVVSQSKKKKTPSQPSAIFVPTLPDVPMLLIFDHLPLYDLVTRVPLVCTKWRVLQPLACRKRTHISLLVNDPQQIIPRQANNIKDPSLPYLIRHEHCVLSQDDFKADFPGTDYSRLVLPNFSRNVIRMLVHLFPKVITLEIAVNIASSGTFNQIAYLLDLWFSKLVTLKLWTWWDETNGKRVPESSRKTANVGRLFQSLNTIQSLRFFTFFADTTIFIYPDPMPPDYTYPKLDLQFLSRLEVFKFSTFDPARVLFNSLKQVLNCIYIL